MLVKWKRCDFFLCYLPNTCFTHLTEFLQVFIKNLKNTVTVPKMQLRIITRCVFIYNYRYLFINSRVD
jgi:hypothetical protein